MGADRDFERDENLDFSDLSDSNQAKLANEQKTGELLNRFAAMTAIIRLL